ncbi:16S rRNA (cytosine(1402)-N(4))-methyltransferase RsmH [Amphiplicatus metriothermophilus]|uniref:Ribosomal RNA small subunit methyltransferase H n=1 Tax=Amphiplicatus metriothermophilus TaxID=1519374 RepID=A0A239PSP7_9PROT|nr:16S rRNA (cytosine(1402)-N(4))-methyltransferase RsmH [Amphiplicatus metriothermophilus]MBB5519245.1 16S rRNA (cytosine1402-N4)-methyltransferase [Amphiplicatus metriothermophilus]SNT73314.1 16S rRNA (cytosine1402-N4)-methyltransferase [Amphiplicatus metriothermophilus]
MTNVDTSGARASHAPVMVEEMLAALAPVDHGVYVDATFGGGGYARAILAAADCRVYGFDRDPVAIERGREWAGAYAGRLALINRPFAEMEAGLAEAGVDALDGAVFDLGVSSMQLDEPARGFSFRHDGPLSMRMDGGRPDAADVVNQASEKALAAIFKGYGEERHARRIAKAVVRERDKAPIETTGRLAEIVAAAVPARGAARIHPATRVFQALRIFVNDELGQLAEGLAACERLLRPAGRLVVVTFHSLEDRMVKHFLAARARAPGGSRHAPPAADEAPAFRLLFAKARRPSEAEVADNPRARSAKLRAAVRADAPARGAPAETFARGIPSLSDVLSDALKKRS